ncbi:MAG: hypothetical protein QM752_02185 [Gammaproteobacteria bacterium]
MQLFANSTRGGQVILHSLRMVCQILGKINGLSFLSLGDEY